MREEGPPSGWRPEGLRPSNRLRPRGERGGAPCGRGRDQRPVHHRVHGWQHLPHRRTLARRGRGGKAAPGGGGAGPAEANPPGGARGRGWGHRLRPKHPSPGALWSRAAPRPSGARAGEPPPLLGTPTFGAQNLPPRPSFAGVSAATVAGKRAPPLLPLLHPSRATRFSSFSVNNSWVAGGGGKVAPAESGRAPPTHPRAAV